MGNNTEKTAEEDKTKRHPHTFLWFFSVTFLPLSCCLSASFAPVKIHYISSILVPWQKNIVGHPSWSLIPISGVHIASSLLEHSHMALPIPLFSSKAFRGGSPSKKWDNGASDRLESSRGWDEARLWARERHTTGAFANPTQCGAFAPGKKDASKQPSAIFAVQWTE